MCNFCISSVITNYIILISSFYRFLSNFRNFPHFPFDFIFVVERCHIMDLLQWPYYAITIGMPDDFVAFITATINKSNRWPMINMRLPPKQYRCSKAYKTKATKNGLVKWLVCEKYWDIFRMCQLVMLLVCAPHTWNQAETHNTRWVWMIKLANEAALHVLSICVWRRYENGCMQ